MRMLLALAVVSLSCRTGFAAEKDVHRTAIVIDSHVDTTQRLLEPNFDLAARHVDGGVDIPRMREGGVSGIFFSIWIPSSIIGPIAIKKALDQVDAVREEVRKHKKYLELATSADEIVGAKSRGKIAILMGLEGGHMIDNDLSVLRLFAALGVRYVTLTHSANHDWAGSSTDKFPKGLNDFGRQVVIEMNRLGMMIDVSHVSDQTFYDALATSKAPIIASHSSCRNVVDVPRNLTDQMIRDLAKSGGVIHINYNAGFISEEFQTWRSKHPEKIKELDNELKKRCNENAACENLQKAQILAELGAPRVSFENIIEQIDHAVKVAGIDHVGLGSDFDGAPMPIDMQDISKLPQIAKSLTKRGYSDVNIRKILGGNTLRVMREVERVSGQWSPTAK